MIIIIWGLKLQFQINISQPSSRKFLGMKKKHSDLLWSNKYFSLFTTSYIKIFCLFDKFYKTIEWLSCLGTWEVLKNFEKFLRRKCKGLPITYSWLIAGSISVSYLVVIFVNGCPLEEVDVHAIKMFVDKSGIKIRQGVLPELAQKQKPLS